MIRSAAFASLLILLSCNGSSGHGPRTPANENPSDPSGPGLTDSEVLTARPDNTSCVAFPKPNDGTTIKLEQKFGAASYPEIVGFQQAPQNKRFYTIRRTGQINTFTKDDGSDQTMFMDMSGAINSETGEAGLLGIAWHPTKKDEFYLSYTISSGDSAANLRSVIARFHSADGLTAKNEPEILLTLEQPYTNHNGGHIAFGPDGFLYIGFGDGGSGGDPQNRAQNLNELFGKILRIDVNSGSPYAIPSDNPFINQDGKKAEIYAYGVRNPWRFQFDRATGELWLGDVGQDKLEEVDKVVKGGNYGWNIREANTCYNQDSCNQGNTIDPIAFYPHSEGNSITGGFVYRGKKIPSLVGVYLYADFGTGKIWGLYPNENGALTPKLLLTPGFNISSFGEDLNGELYVLEYGAGKIHSIVSQAAGDTVSAPDKLSKTGCFDAKNVKNPVSGLIPYLVNSPLWSDGATKRRWIGLPNGKNISLGDDGHLNFPNGTVLVKEFSLENKPVETRLFIHHDDGSWAGYTYAWNDEGTDADLVLNGKTKVFGNQTWVYPSQGQCLQCHNSNVGFSLSPTVGQLNRTIGSSAPVPQLDVFEKIGLFDKALPAERAVLPIPLETSDKAAAARSYMDANCSFCHRPGGTGGGDLDLRFTTNFKDTGLCDKTPGSGDLGIADARVIAPKDPERSVLFKRVTTRGPKQMPPLASNLVDEDMKAVLESWIKDLQSCP